MSLVGRLENPSPHGRDCTLLHHLNKLEKHLPKEYLFGIYKNSLQLFWRKRFFKKNFCILAIFNFLPKCLYVEFHDINMIVTNYDGLESGIILT